MNSKRLGAPSNNLASKLALPSPEKYAARHSILNIRSGELPDTEVYTPHPSVHVVALVKKDGAPRSSWVLTKFQRGKVKEAQ